MTLLTRAVAAVPAQEQWDVLNGPAQKTVVESLIEVTLNEIGAQGREPDEWEAKDLGAALNAIMMGWYRAALSYAVMALQPPESRAGSWDRLDTTPRAQELLDALYYVQGMPSRG